MDKKRLRAKAYEVLEWPRLLRRLAERALSSSGKDACHNLVLATTLEGARRSLDETSELLALIREGGSVPLGAFEDVRDIVQRCEKGAVVKPEELNHVASLIELSRIARGFFRNFAEQTPLLWERVQVIEELDGLRRDIKDMVDESGRIKENATPELRRRLQSLRDQRAHVVARIEEYMRREEISLALQDAYYTQRGNRYVLPVKADFKHRVNGIVHDSSQSGQTLYIEPQQFIDSNNRLKMAELEVDQEVERIVRELVSRVAHASAALRMNFEILTELDVIYAKARLAKELDATAPSINDRGVISLRNIRHPHLVLQPAEVVPNDIEMDEDLKAIIISGPNTGGKTVMLKTVGLFALMVRAGMLLSADENGEMALFPDVWSDIGDEQDIETHLSTFSGHILNIIGIIDSVRPGSLVLLDELVTSTDPSEGSALAEAILHKLVERGAKVVATTHYTQLKAYAEGHPGFQNAGVEFDGGSLTPTYRFKQGIPGRSSALEIASRLGMDRDVIDRARDFLSTADKRVEDMLSSLEKQDVALREKIEEVEASLERARQLKKEHLELRDKLRERERDFRRTMRTRLNDDLMDARDHIREVLHSLDNVRTRKAVAEAQATIRDMEHKYTDIGPLEGEPADPDTLKAGDAVVISHLGISGVLQENVQDKNKVKVRVGKADMVAPVDSLRSYPDAPVPQPEDDAPDWAAINRKRGKGVIVTATPSSTTIDLRGYRTDDALAEVERFLDRASASGTWEIEIIHGHGTGTLKKFVRDFLRRSSYVKSWDPAPIERGGDGVTVVSLKKDS